MSKATLIKAAEDYKANLRDDGRNGKAFECFDKIANKVTRTNKVTSNQKPFDYQKKGIKIESKTRCGVIGTIDKNGDISFNKTLKADIIRYSPTASIEDVYTLTAEDFITVIKMCGLVKVNKSRKTVNIQTFYTSKKKEAEFRNALESVAIH